MELSSTIYIEIHTLVRQVYYAQLLPYDAVVVHLLLVVVYFDSSLKRNKNTNTQQNLKSRASVYFMTDVNRGSSLLAKM